MFPPSVNRYARVAADNRMSSLPGNDFTGWEFPDGVSDACPAEDLARLVQPYGTSEIRQGSSAPRGIVFIKRVRSNAFARSRSNLCWDYTTSPKIRATCSAHTLWQIEMGKSKTVLAGTPEFASASTDGDCVSCCESETVYNAQCSPGSGRSFSECCPYQRRAPNAIFVQPYVAPAMTPAPAPAATPAPSPFPTLAPTPSPTPISTPPVSATTYAAGMRVFNAETSVFDSCFGLVGNTHYTPLCSGYHRKTAGSAGWVQATVNSQNQQCISCCDTSYGNSGGDSRCWFMSQTFASCCAHDSLSVSPAPAPTADHSTFPLSASKCWPNNLKVMVGVAVLRPMCGAFKFVDSANVPNVPAFNSSTASNLPCRSCCDTSLSPTGDARCWPAAGAGYAACCHPPAPTPGPPNAGAATAAFASKPAWDNATQSPSPWTNVLKVTDSWWNGRLPERSEQGPPRGHQISDFVTAVLKYQVYCAQRSLPTAPLYDPEASRTNGPPAPFSDAAMQQWVADLFNDFLTGALRLPLIINAAGLKEVPSALLEFGGAKEICAKLPSVTNYVSGCDCRVDPQCVSRKEHKFTFFFGSKGIIAELNMDSPVPTSCSYFRQLEAFEKMGVKNYQPLIDITRTNARKIAGVNVSYNVNLTDLVELRGVKWYSLRDRLQAAMVKKWNPAFDYREPETNATSVWSEYLRQCEPTRCYYFQKQTNSLATKLGLFLAIIGGLVALLKPAINGAVNGIANKLVGKPKDISELHMQKSEELVATLSPKPKLGALGSSMGSSMRNMLGNSLKMGGSKRMTSLLSKPSKVVPSRASD